MLVFTKKILFKFKNMEEFFETELKEVENVSLCFMLIMIHQLKSISSTQ